ncbi:MAG: EamA family transporter RarD [Pseudomonadota bacterium]
MRVNSASSELPSEDAVFRRGLTAGLGAYLVWGLAPLYFKLLQAVRADEIIAHRVIWSIGFLLLILLMRHRADVVRHVRIPRTVALALLASSVLLAINSLLFVQAVHAGRVLETSLGYFISPMVSVVLGLVLLSEQLLSSQRWAVLLAAAGTAYLFFSIEPLPWFALGIAISWGLYGLVRKVTNVGPMVGLLWETVLMAPAAIAWLFWLDQRGEQLFGQLGIDTDALLIGTGMITVVPLVLFATAARSLPLITLGLMQYIAPTMSFLLAVFLFREPFTWTHAVAFSAIWCALFIYSMAGWRRARSMAMNH